MSVEEVTRILRCIPDKQCDLDPVPTMLIKSMCDVCSPIIASIANTSFEQSIFPSSHKHAIVRPRIKKPSGDPLDIKSYRPISNLSFISKVVERLAVNRLSEHTSQHRLLQSASPPTDDITRWRPPLQFYTMISYELLTPVLCPHWRFWTLAPLLILSTTTYLLTY